MGREVLSVHLGQAGSQIASALWELFCLEHNIAADGMPRYTDHEPDDHLENIYYETKQHKFIPRAIIVDLEPTVIDEMRTGAYRRLWNPSCLISGNEDAANNYARGYYTVGKEHVCLVLEAIRKLVNKCENLTTFQITHSLAGGTGSGMSSLLLQYLQDCYGKKYKFGFGVFPSPTMSQATVDPYNTLLQTHASITQADCDVLLDNEALYEKAINNINVAQPTFATINRCISQMMSSVFLSHRYDYFNSQQAHMSELLTNLIPYPRIHFPLLSYSPFINFDQLDHQTYTAEDLTDAAFQMEGQAFKCRMDTNKYMSCALLYRGDLSLLSVYEAVRRVKSDRNIRFVDWCPTAFKIGINYCPPTPVPHSEIGVSPRALCMVAGNAGVKDAWCRMSKKFHLLYSKRAFVHWYVAEGMEEGEFQDALDDILYLIKDYEEICKESDMLTDYSDPDPFLSSTLSNSSHSNAQHLKTQLWPTRKDSNANFQPAMPTIFSTNSNSNAVNLHTLASQNGISTKSCHNREHKRGNSDCGEKLRNRNNSKWSSEHQKLTSGRVSSSKLSLSRSGAAHSCSTRETSISASHHKVKVLKNLTENRHQAPVPRRRSQSVQNLRDLCAAPQHLLPPPRFSGVRKKSTWSREISPKCNQSNSRSEQKSSQIGASGDSMGMVKRLSQATLSRPSNESLTNVTPWFNSCKPVPLPRSRSSLSWKAVTPSPGLERSRLRSPVRMRTLSNNERFGRANDNGTNTFRKTVDEHSDNRTDSLPSSSTDNTLVEIFDKNHNNNTDDEDKFDVNSLTCICNMSDEITKDCGVEKQSIRRRDKVAQRGGKPIPTPRRVKSHLGFSPLETVVCEIKLDSTSNKTDLEESRTQNANSQPALQPECLNLSNASTVGKTCGKSRKDLNPRKIPVKELLNHLVKDLEDGFADEHKVKKISEKLVKTLQHILIKKSKQPKETEMFGDDQLSKKYREGANVMAKNDQLVDKRSKLGSNNSRMTGNTRQNASHSVGKDYLFRKQHIKEMITHSISSNKTFQKDSCDS